MKIAFIGQKGIPCIAGGVEKHVEDLAVHLVRAGHEVLAYTRPHYTNKNLKNYQGVELISLPTISTKHLDAIAHTFLACLDVIFRRQVDIVHFHSIGPASLLWLIKIFKPNTPIITTFHSQCYNHQKWNKLAQAYLKFGEYICCKLADKTIVISRGLKKYVEEKYYNEVYYFPNGVNEAKHFEAQEIKKWNLKGYDYILALGRLAPPKGFEYLIQAYQKLETDKKLVIVGGSEESHSKEYELKLRKLAGDNKNIIFTGRQSGRVVQEFFQYAYLAVVPSIVEGLSIALLEMMSYGKGVLVSDIPENKEPVQNCGFTFKSKNINDLAEKLDYLLNNPQEIKNKGFLAKKRVKNNYLWEKIIQDIVNLYNNSLLKKQEAVKNLKRETN